MDDEPRPPSLLRRRWSSALLVAVVAAAPVLALTAPSARAASQEFPSPVEAPLRPPAGLPAPLSVRGFHVEPSQSGRAVIIDFAGAVKFAGGDTYRAAVHIGSPSKSHTRVSLVVQAGVPVGSVEKGNGDTWTSVGATTAGFGADTASIELPNSVYSQIGADTLVWLDLRYTPKGGSAQRYVSPLFPAVSVLDSDQEPALVPASVGWLNADKQPPTTAVDLPESPAVRVAGGQLTVSFFGKPPSTIGTRKVTKVVDVVRITPSFSQVSTTPYLIAIDHTAGTISLLDGTTPVPAEIRTDRKWLVKGLPPGGVDTGDKVVVDLGRLWSALGIDSGGATTGIGLARTLTASGTKVVADGPLATLDWYATAARAGVPTATPTSAKGKQAVRSFKGSKGPDLGKLGVIAGVAVVVVIVVSGGLVASHRRRDRIEAALVGPHVEHQTHAHTHADDEAVDRLTQEIFGD